MFAGICIATSHASQRAVSTTEFPKHQSSRALLTRSELRQNRKAVGSSLGRSSTIAGDAVLIQAPRWLPHLRSSHSNFESRVYRTCCFDNSRPCAAQGHAHAATNRQGARECKPADVVATAPRPRCGGSVLCRRPRVMQHKTSCSARRATFRLRLMVKWNLILQQRVATHGNSNLPMQ